MNSSTAKYENYCLPGSVFLKLIIVFLKHLYSMTENDHSLWVMISKKEMLVQNKTNKKKIQSATHLPSPSLQFGQEQATLRNLLLG